MLLEQLIQSPCPEAFPEIEIGSYVNGIHDSTIDDAFEYKLFEHKVLQQTLHTIYYRTTLYSISIDKKCT